ncbi:MAG: ABC transporter ATP-binding protein [Candidatus Gracilibacteria bacterium]
MNYKLNQDTAQKKVGTLEASKKLLPLLKGEEKQIAISAVALLFNSATNLIAPLIIGLTVDKYIQTGDFGGVLYWAAILSVLFLIGLATNYIQTKVMGGVGQRILFKLRNKIFLKLQELPIAFFNQNKAGDLISRINNDTDKLNQFFSQALTQFIGNLCIMIGTGLFILFIHIKLGAAALFPALLLLIFTQLISPWVKKKNSENLKSTGGLSSEIQESLNNFKAIIAFNRRDYFRKRFNEANTKSFQTGIWAGIANTIFTPIYALSYNIAQIIVLGYGIYLISQGDFTIGLLISFFTYLSRFYDPLRHLAALWASFQVALAGWDRISSILSLETDLTQIEDTSKKSSDAVLEFKNVSFTYPEGKHVLSNINFTLDHGKTYALVGPTGGGKTTTASLMARLFDPTEGTVLLNGKDIRSYTSEERTAKIGFILQEPFLFSGTLKDNILYGNDEYNNTDTESLKKTLTDAGLDTLLSQFSEGLETKITGNDAISLGQKQLIAFIRAVLRKPEILILDEATANIDTVTEQLLETVLTQLPKSTTRVIIAHRLNTIEAADEIFFVNGGSLTLAHSMEEAVHMLLDEKKES